MNNADDDAKVIARAREEWAQSNTDRLATTTERALGAIISERADGDVIRDDAIGLLISANRLFIVSYGTRMAGDRRGSFDGDDIDAIAMKAALVAARKYDGNHGRFCTYAGYWIRQAMQRELYTREVSLAEQSRAHDDISLSLMSQQVSLDRAIEVNPSLEPVSDGDDPADRVISADTARVVCSIIDSLPATEREYIRSCVLGCDSPRAFAKHHDMPVRSVYLVRAAAFAHMRDAATGAGLHD